MKQYLLIILIILSSPTYGQLIDDFDDKSFPSDPTWVGDTDDFIVNDSGELQLNSDGSSVSSLFSTLNLPNDTAEISMNFHMDFSPSGSNKLRVYLMVDDMNVSNASGYFFELGETGSDDVIKLYRLDSGAETQIGEGELGAVAVNPNVNFRLDVFPSGLLSFNVDYDGGTFLEEDIVVMDGSYNIGDAMFFGFTCTYTASRADLFFFDDVNVKLFEKDATGPKVISADIVDETTALVVFDEPVDKTSAENVTNYNISGLNVVSAILQSNPTEVLVSFDTSFPSDKTFDLGISGVKDEVGNTMEGAASFEILYPRQPASGDILINEVMFASAVDNEDYVELINTTFDYINLKGLVLGNADKTDRDLHPIISETVLAPEGIIAFTEEKQVLIDTYRPIAEANIIQQEIPGYNNGNGNVLLLDAELLELDSYDYDEDFHSPLLIDVRGVSLERVSTTFDTNDPDGWTSAAGSVNFGTPGYANSNSTPTIEITDNFQFVEKVFSPNNDGDNDIMVLGYSLDKPGYVANIHVKDIGGFTIKTLKSNETLSTSGLITWDGLDMEQKLANIGMYIVVGEVFHTDGEVIPLKKVCVLAARLD